MSNRDATAYFSAGPARLPTAVLEKAQSELMDYNGLGYSVLEMSHRTPDFDHIISSAEQNCKDLLGLNDNYTVLFLQGGGWGQFAGVPLNILKSGTADYLVTGSWSRDAVAECGKYGTANQILPVVQEYTGLPDKSTWNALNPNADYLYYCDNETINGVEMPCVPDCLPGVPLVADMSSNIMTRVFDANKFGIIYAGAQKNIGPAGVTLVCVRNDLIGYARKECPTFLNYGKQTKKGHNAMFNTPPSFSIYMVNLVFEWIKAEGGVKVMEERTDAKAKMLYDIIDKYPDFYCCKINKPCRSRVNVTFRVGSSEGNEDLEKVFMAEAGKIKLKQLKGHRSVGGIRASLYNAITLDETKRLVDFMTEFHASHAK